LPVPARIGHGPVPRKEAIPPRLGKNGGKVRKERRSLAGGDPLDGSRGILPGGGVPPAGERPAVLFLGLSLRVSSPHLLVSETPWGKGLSLTGGDRVRAAFIEKEKRGPRTVPNTIPRKVFQRSFRERGETLTSQPLDRGFHFRETSSADQSRKTTSGDQ